MRRIILLFTVAAVMAVTLTVGPVSARRLRLAQVGNTKTIKPGDPRGGVLTALRRTPLLKSRRVLSRQGRGPLLISAQTPKPRILAALCNRG